MTYYRICAGKTHIPVGDIRAENDEAALEAFKVWLLEKNSLGEYFLIRPIASGKIEIETTAKIHTAVEAQNANP